MLVDKEMKVVGHEAKSQKFQFSVQVCQGYTVAPFRYVSPEITLEETQEYDVVTIVKKYALLVNPSIIYVIVAFGQVVFVDVFSRHGIRLPHVAPQSNPLLRVVP